MKFLKAMVVVSRQVTAVKPDILRSQIFFSLSFEETIFFLLLLSLFFLSFDENFFIRCCCFGWAVGSESADRLSSVCEIIDLSIRDPVDKSQDLSPKSNWSGSLCLEAYFRRCRRRRCRTRRGNVNHTPFRKGPSPSLLSRYPLDPPTQLVILFSFPS